MASLNKRIERIWWRRETPPLFLRLLEPLYATISRRHLQSRAAHAIKPPLPLISVGNITAGGSGKTPFVIWLAGELKSRGHAPVILCRGDGGRLKHPKRVDAHDDAALVGDEALLLAQESGCPVFAGKDRIAAARLAARHGDVLILDDGFQYRQLGRCCDIVLVPAEGLGNGHQIPAGPLREPVAALERADIIVRTGAGTAKSLGFGREWRWQSRPGELRNITQVQANVPNEVLAICGIARPERFTADLESVGLRVSATRFFPDHHAYTAEDVRTILAHGLPVVVTGKDAVKLRSLWPKDRPLWILPQSGEAEEGLCPEITSKITHASATSL